MKLEKIVIDGKEQEVYVSEPFVDTERVIEAVMMSDLLPAEKIAEITGIPLGLAQKFQRNKKTGEDAE